MDDNQLQANKIMVNRENYKRRQENFLKLRNGIIKKYVEDNLDLEDAQADCILKIADTKKEDYSLSTGYFHACTAFGKTYLMMAMVESYYVEEKDKKVLILEENQSVLEQVRRDFLDKTSFNDDEIGAYYSKEKTPDNRVIIGTYASMEKLIEDIGKENIGLVLCDEAHHILSKKRQSVAKEFSNACLYGFTATPDYNIDKGCSLVFGQAIDTVTLKDGVEKGLLCGFKNGLLISKVPVNLTEIRNNRGDYDAEKFEEILTQSHLSGMREELANFYLGGFDENLGRIRGKTTIINVPNQKEAERVTKVFNEKAGKTIAKAYHSNTSEEPLKEFNEGKFPILVQVNRISEGYSNPKVEVCINYPTASRVRETQRGGRALRRDKDNPNKMSLIIDIAFKKSDKKSDLEEVRDNNQVLFMDIAEEIMLCHNGLGKNVQRRNISNIEGDSKDTDIGKLFKIITSYEKLYELKTTQLINAEKSSILPKQDGVHIIQSDFVSGQWVMRDKNRILTCHLSTQIGNIFKQAHQENSDLVFYVRPQNGSPILAFNRNKLEEVKKLFRKFGIEIRSPEEIGVFPEKQEGIHIIGADISRGKWGILINGKSIKHEKTNPIFMKCHKERPDLVFYIKPKNGSTQLAFDRRQLTEVKKLFKQFGIELISDKETEVIPQEQEKYKILERIFSDKWDILKNGESLVRNKEQLEILIAKSHEKRPDLVFYVRSGNERLFLAFDIEKTKEVKNLFEELGAELITPIESLYRKQRYSKTILPNEKKDLPKKQENIHIVPNDFRSTGKWRAVKDGRELGDNFYKVIRQYFYECQKKRPDLIFNVVTRTDIITLAFNVERLQEVKQLFKEEFSIDILAPFEREEIIKYQQDFCSSSDFVKQNIITTADGKNFSGGKYTKEGAEIFAKCQALRPDLIFKVCMKSGKKVWAFEKKKSSEFKEVLDSLGIKFKQVETLSQKVETLSQKVDNVNRSSIPQKQNNFHVTTRDLIAGSWSIKKGKSIIRNTEEIKQLFNVCYENNPEVFFYVCTKSGLRLAFDVEHITEAKNSFKDLGYEIISPNEKARDKLTTDVGKYEFYQRWIVKKDNKSLDRIAKSDLYNAIQESNPELFTIVKNNISVVSIENQEVFKETLKDMGYDVMSPRDRIHELQEKMEQAPTPEERKKYFEEARTIFRKYILKDSKTKCDICRKKTGYEL